MEKKGLSRKEFLANSSKFAVGAVAGIAGLNTLAGTKIFANNEEYIWPFPYEALDPEEIRIRAHHLKLNGLECCAGMFGSFVEALKTKIGDPYNALPYELMLYGRGGGAGWGSLCGAVNASAACISLVVNKADSGLLIMEVYGWAASELLPTDIANQAALDNRYTAGSFNGVALPQSIAGSVMCHASLANWCGVADKKIGDPERKERCARITGDMAVKTVEVINAYHAGNFSPQFVTPEYAQQCLTCHGSSMLYNARSQESCEPCHGDPHSTTTLERIDELPKAFEMKPNYPNPFNPTTRIQFSVPNESKVHLAVYDIMGGKIATLVDHDSFKSGSYEVEWNGQNSFGDKVTSGIYFARIEAGNMQRVIKMNLMK
jgi:Putative redox-active protein (C_GCAxxG_C_C)/Secretion system C-terminal sorting domain